MWNADRRCVRWDIAEQALLLPRTDVTVQLQDLRELRDTGILTDVEFETKKADPLERLCPRLQRRPEALDGSLSHRVLALRWSVVLEQGSQRGSHSCRWRSP